MHNALLYQEFKTLLFSLLRDASEEILLPFASNCDFNDRVKDEKYQEFIIQVNMCMLNSSSTRAKHHSSYTFLKNLIQQNIPLYPALKDYLFKVSEISGTIEPYLSFSIFEYLEHFCNGFPIESVILLENVFNSNDIRDLTLSSHHIFNLINKLFSIDLPATYRDKLVRIVKECSMDGEPYCKAYADRFMKELDLL